LIESSPTNHILAFTIHNILPIISAISIVVCISFGSSGIFGAGGNTGNSNFTLGINEGISGRSGGAGITGIDGKFIDTSNFSSCIIRLFIIFVPADIQSRFKDISMVGGFGILGKSGNGTEVGTKLNLGNFMSVAKFIFDKSIYMFGIFIGGIFNIGRLSGHNNPNLQAN
jgi:hypothetical protein